MIKRLRHIKCLTRLETLYHRRIIKVDDSIFLRKSPSLHLDKIKMGVTSFIFYKNCHPSLTIQHLIQNTVNYDIDKHRNLYYNKLNMHLLYGRRDFNVSKGFHRTFFR